jgi:hypothetical protein
MPSSRRRRWLVAGALGVFTAGLSASQRAGNQAMVEVWIDLSEPVAAAASGASEAARRRSAVAAQQDRVSQRLRTLGVLELERIRHSRNSMLVRIERDRLTLLHEIPEVVRVRPSQILHPPKPMPSGGSQPRQ